MGESGKNLAPTNSARDAHAFINRWGLSWRVPHSLFKYQESGQTYEFSYLSPVSFTKYLLEKAPQLVMGGIDGCQGRQNLESFWASYRAIDPEHIFSKKIAQGEHHPTLWLLLFMEMREEVLKKATLASSAWKLFWVCDIHQPSGIQLPVLNVQFPLKGQNALS